MTTVMDTKEGRKFDFDPRTNFLFESLNFEPTCQEQAEILRSSKRFLLITGGEQSGKSTLCAKKWLKEFTLDLDRYEREGWPAPLIYWLVGADYERTKQEFQYIKDDLSVLGWLDEKGTTKKVDPGVISIKGGTAGDKIIARIETKSAQDITKLAMVGPAGIMICEGGAPMFSKDAYDRCMARTAPHQSWLYISGTMEGSVGWFPTLRNEWDHGDDAHKAFSLPSWTNWRIYPGGRDDPEIVRLRAESGDDFYLERIEGIPCPPKGLVIPEFSSALHIREVEYTPGIPVHLWVDPGYRHHCAVEVVQIINGQVQVIDEVYVRGLIVDEVVTHCESKVWWKDVQIGHHVIDYAGTLHAGQMPPAASVWQDHGVYMHSNRVEILEGIDRFKSYLKVDPITQAPKLVVSPNCKGLLSELGSAANPFDRQVLVYRWKLDNNGLPVGRVPIDAHNDAIKAVTYGLVDMFGYAGVRGSKKAKVQRFNKTKRRWF